MQDFKKKNMSKNKAAAATQMFHWYNIENQRHGINKDYLPNNTALVPFFGNYRDDKSFFYLGPLVIVSAVAFFLVLVLRLVENLLAAFLLFSFPNTLFFFQGKWRGAEELYTTAPRLHKSWPKAVAVTLHTIKRNSNSNVSNVRKTDRWIQLYYTIRYISYHYRVGR